MSKKTVSVLLAQRADDIAADLAAHYGMNKSNLLNRILQRIFAEESMMNLMGVRVEDRGSLVKRSYRIDEELITALEESGLPKGTVLERAALYVGTMGEEQQREFLFS